MTENDFSEISYKNGYNKALEDLDVCVVEDFGNVSNAKVYGLKNSARRSKFPMSTSIDTLEYDVTERATQLAQTAKGEGHDQWLTGVVVQFDLRFSNKAWVEAERYHFLDFVSSQSTMHCITKFDINKCFNEYVDSRIIFIIKEKLKEFDEIESAYKSITNELTQREAVQARKILREKRLEILYNIPSGFMLTAGMTTNYRQLKTIYSQRRTHRLPEWRLFCKWIETLPHSELITGKES